MIESAADHHPSLIRTKRRWVQVAAKLPVTVVVSSVLSVPRTPDALPRKGGMQSC